MKKTSLFLVLLISTLLLTLATAHDETKKVCSSSIIDTTIDGYRLDDTNGNFEGKFTINQETGKLLVKAEGISNLDETVSLESGMEITSIEQNKGNYFLEGYAPMLTIVEGNARMGIRNVPMVVHWNTKKNVVYIGYTHPLIEETAITWKQSC